MGKIARLFTIDYAVYEAARKSIPNMSEVVENALKSAVEAQNSGVDEAVACFKGVSRKLLSKAVNRMSMNPIKAPEIAEAWAPIINKRCNTQLQPQHLISYYEQIDIIK